MRISFSGAACTGKTTTLHEFLRRWPAYKQPEASYRSVITNNKHSKQTDKNTQRKIIEFMIDQQKQYTLHDKVAFDRCGLDNIVYSLWAHDKGKKGFTEDFISTGMGLVRESMRSLDIIFLMTRDQMPPVIENNNKREVDPKYIEETDNIFKAIYKQFSTSGALSLFPHGDSPVLIEISGTTEERIEQIGMYINPEGDMYGEEQSLVNTEEIAKMEKLLREQQETVSKERGILPK
jgi:hypothetical protein